MQSSTGQKKKTGGPQNRAFADRGFGRSSAPHSVTATSLGLLRTFSFKTFHRRSWGDADLYGTSVGGCRRGPTLGCQPYPCRTHREWTHGSGDDPKRHRPRISEPKMCHEWFERKNIIQINSPGSNLAKFPELFGFMALFPLLRNRPKIAKREWQKRDICHFGAHLLSPSSLKMIDTFAVRRGLVSSQV